MRTLRTGRMMVCRPGALFGISRDKRTKSHLEPGPNLEGKGLAGPVLIRHHEADDEIQMEADPPCAGFH